MGQRSQIYVRYHNENGEVGIAARYYSWNYGERMISRARYTMEWLKEHYQYLFFEADKIPHILDINFDMKDCVISGDILKEYQDDLNEEDSPNGFMFYGQDNNDGQLLIDVARYGSIKYAFIQKGQTTPMLPDEYMEWDIGSEWNTETEYNSKSCIATCQKNIRKIKRIAKLMTEEEVKEFISYDYTSCLPQKPKTNWFTTVVNILAGNGSETVWCDDNGQILTKTEEAANIVANLIEAFYRSQGEEISVNTGYYDPEDDKRSGVGNNHTGWWYICVN